MQRRRRSPRCPKTTNLKAKLELEVDLDLELDKKTRRKRRSLNAKTRQMSKTWAQKENSRCVNNTGNPVFRETKLKGGASPKLLLDVVHLKPRSRRAHTGLPNCRLWWWEAMLARP